MRAAILAAALGALAFSGCNAGPSCGVNPQCASLTSYFQCNGADVVRTECPAPQLCALDAKSAPGCQAGFEVTGTASYGKRTPTRQGLADPVQTPIPNASASVVDESGTVVGTGYTHDDGTFSVAYAPVAGVKVHLLLATSADPSTNVALRVVGKSATYGYAAEPFLSEAAHAQNVAITDSMGSQTFNVYVSALGAFKHLLTLTTKRFPLLQYQYYTGSPGSYYQSATDTISLLQSPGDSDGFDDSVIDHEFGHYVQEHIAEPRSSGGEHTGEPADPLLAWSEGYASYYSSSTRGSSLYIDTYADDAAPSGFASYVFDIHSNDQLADPKKAMTQNISEWLVSEVLWELEDKESPGLGYPQVASMNVLAKLGNNGSDRGVFDVDLVDFLDEWFVLRGTGDCAGMKSLLALKQFPYDFAAPGHACP